MALRILQQFRVASVDKHYSLWKHLPLKPTFICTTCQHSLHYRCNNIDSDSTFTSFSKSKTEGKLLNLNLNSPIYISVCPYGNKNKQKSEKGKRHKARIPDDDVEEYINVEELHASMDETIEELKEKCRSAVGASLNKSLDKVPVKTKDGEYALGTVAQVIKKSPQLIQITVVNKGYFEDVKNAILKAGLGTNMQVADTTLFIAVKRPTEELRKEYLSTFKTLGKQTQMQIGKVYSKYSKKSTGKTKDDAYMLDDYLKQEKDKYVKKAEEFVKEEEDKLLKLSKSS